MGVLVLPESQNRIRGGPFDAQPSGEVRFWIRLSLAVTSGTMRLDPRGLILWLNGPRLTAAG